MAQGSFNRPFVRDRTAYRDSDSTVVASQSSLRGRLTVGAQSTQTPPRLMRRATRTTPPCFLSLLGARGSLRSGAFGPQGSQ